MDEQQQSCMTECVYCTKVRPDIGAECPRCGGRRIHSQPAQMMCGELSRQSVLQSLFAAGVGVNALQTASASDDERAKQQAQELCGRLIGILQSMSIHGFDLETAVIEMIQSLEREFGLPAPGE